MTPSQIEDAIRNAAAIAARNLDDALALEDPGPAWCLAIWLGAALRSAGTDPAEFAAGIIGASVEYEAEAAA